jgi:transposase
MPRKECSVVEERLLFVARLLDGEAMTDLCREFGISRKTGYKIFDRYKEHGLEALTDRSRRPVRYANQLPSQVESLIVSLKRNKPHWGARKIRELLLRRLPRDLRLPAKSTIHAVLDRHGLVKRMSKRRSRATGTPLSKAFAPNDAATSRIGPLMRYALYVTGFLAVSARRLRSQRWAISLSTRGCHAAITSKPGTSIGGLSTTSRLLFSRSRRDGTSATRSSVCKISGTSRKLGTE